MKKIIGIILVSVDFILILLAVLLNFSTRQYRPAGAEPEIGFYFLVCLWILLLLLGNSFVLSDQIQERLQRRRQKKEERQSERYKRTEKQKRSELPRNGVEGWTKSLVKNNGVRPGHFYVPPFSYQSRIDREVKVFRNQGVQLVTMTKVFSGILLWGGALASIPIVSFVIDLKPPYIGIYTVIATCLFWFGVIVWGSAVGERNLQRVTGFAVSNLWEVYYININRKIYEDHIGIPFSRSVRLIKTLEKAQYVAQKENQQQQQLYGSQADAIVKERISQLENREIIRDDLMVVTKINHPRMHRKLSGKIIIDYVNETSGLAESAILFPTNQGYDRIILILEKSENRERSIQH